MATCLICVFAAPSKPLTILFMSEMHSTEISKILLKKAAGDRQCNATCFYKSTLHMQRSLVSNSRASHANMRLLEHQSSRCGVIFSYQHAIGNAASFPNLMAAGGKQRARAHALYHEGRFTPVVICHYLEIRSTMAVDNLNE